MRSLYWKKFAEILFYFGSNSLSQHVVFHYQIAAITPPTYFKRDFLCFSEQCVPINCCFPVLFRTFFSTSHMFAPICSHTCKDSDKVSVYVRKNEKYANDEPIEKEKRTRIEFLFVVSSERTDYFFQRKKWENNGHYTCCYASKE